MHRKTWRSRPRHPPLPCQAAPTIPAAAQAIMAGMKKYTEIRVPILAIYAVPHDLGQAFPR